jgi:stage V sporulation protein AA
MAKQNVVSQTPDVEIGDIASIYCEDEVIKAKAESIKIHKFKKDTAPRVVVSMLKVIEQITSVCSGVTVESIGATDIIIQKASFAHDKDKQKSGIGQWIKIAFVAMICFFGSGFTIMAFHNDIGISDVLGRIYHLVTGNPSDRFTVIETAYSIGLAAGIIIFYNHIGGKRLTSDPTPLEVEMRNYENDVNQAIIVMADREKLEKDVQ